MELMIPKMCGTKKYIAARIVRQLIYQATPVVPAKDAEM
jgi:hypothetical protein